ncbi:YidC/Oxa1 family membrane protein insertase [Microbacterium sp. SORGH_AS 1204]|uniref:YidC/Oxa1 family membrane protein insertase n=1 Tax=Microbacterium sp. SORGH_AS_1204 TaxID=3041785 RepID=UPI00278F36C0|nr:membrane protein insertase YidC [Microbacterium sp. SORGH_AS_1204]MDQ1137206.1 YidC/Oxa1 family membrane protein insertase [Microbacterium sp. SORGH_AS_1204]
MDPFLFPPLALLLDLATRAMLALTAALDPLVGSAAAAVAVVAVTLLVRLLLVPVGVSQARAEQTRARLAPRLRVLRERWRNDPERLQRATMQLYRDENVSPAAACLPLLAQAPVVGLLYAVFLHPTVGGQANALLAHDLLGVPLGRSLVAALTSGTADGTTLVVFGSLVAVIVFAVELTRRWLRPSVDPAAPAWTTTITGVLPFSTAVVALFVPLAAALYLAVTTVWTLVQRVLLRRRYPLPQG